MNAILAEAAGVTLPTTGLETTVTSAGAGIGLVINIAFYIGIGICLLFVILGGIKYATSGGDKFAAQEGKSAITNAIIGFVVIVAFRAIIIVVSSALGAPNTTRGLPLF
ncbi:MAG: hypothetical protein ABIB98_01425 [bacterium]